MMKTEKDEATDLMLELLKEGILGFLSALDGDDMMKGVMDARKCKGSASCSDCSLKSLLNGSPYQSKKGYLNCKKFVSDVSLSLWSTLAMKENEAVEGAQKKQNKEEEQRPKHKCEECVHFQIYGPSAFCESWHNFTSANGYCHDFQPKLENEANP